MILIIYTTAYRKGSDMFKRAADTLYQELQQAHPDKNVVCKGIVHKKELVDIFAKIMSNDPIEAYHFIGHSGMYGPMYGTVAYPEQFSPYELKELDIPFAKEAKAYFHCCRSARWFAPFFSKVFGVETFGYHWYTSFTSDKEKFKKTAAQGPVYAMGCKGKKSHGMMGSLKKYTGAEPMEKMQSFSPAYFTGDASYNQVSELYHEVFTDIKVRRDEWKWLSKHLTLEPGMTVMDIGCGNGALLKELAPHIKKGIGGDASENMLKKAREMHIANPHIEFALLTGPELPVADQSVDVVISLLSFRYLDWDPLMNEIKRVLKPGGKILIIDMVTVPVKKKEIPLFLLHKLKQYGQRLIQNKFYSHLKKLVTHPDWQQMIRYNPIRAEHEMKWYLESRFPGKKVEKINIGWHSSVLAFDSGNIEQMNDIYLTYP